jgi:hypothetical protein
VAPHIFPRAALVVYTLAWAPRPGRYRRAKNLGRAKDLGKARSPGDRTQGRLMVEEESTLNDVGTVDYSMPPFVVVREEVAGGLERCSVPDVTSSR